MRREDVWDFPVEVGRVRLRNPVVAASGTRGHGLELAQFGDPSRLGAVVVKSLTVDPRPGFPPPRVSMLAEPGAMVNASGVPNPGVRAWAEKSLPGMLDAKVAVVASLWGPDAERLVAAAEILAAYRGPIAWEINLSCPNSEHAGPPVAHDPDASAAVCRAVRDLAPEQVGVWAKLAPDAPDVLRVALACQEAGADAVTVSNTHPAGPGVAPSSLHLGRGPGGVSGTALAPHVRPMVEKLGAEHPDLPVLACGGVVSSDVAFEYIRLGARAVQVGTATLFDPRACHRIARGLVRKLRAEGRRAERAGRS